ncbi:hypothetical protein MNV49_007703 [Pseudohyphozyma bogoriensis]|nr:hypothetical protein MNV49_007703 [Pseudohyphozyma bogoriensis]
MAQPRLSLLSLPPEVKVLIAEQCKLQDAVKMETRTIPWQGKSLNALFMTCRNFQDICAPLLFDSLKFCHKLADPTFIFDIVPQYGRHFTELIMLGLNSRGVHYDDGTPFYTALSQLVHLRSLTLDLPSTLPFDSFIRPPPSLKSLAVQPREWTSATWRLLETYAPGLESLDVAEIADSQPPPFLDLPCLRNLSGGTAALLRAVASSPLQRLTCNSHILIEEPEFITEDVLLPFLPTLEEVDFKCRGPERQRVDAITPALLERKPTLAIKRPVFSYTAWDDAESWLDPERDPDDTDTPAAPPPRYRGLQSNAYSVERRETRYGAITELLGFYSNLARRQYVQEDDVGLLTTLVNLREANTNAEWDRA